MAAKLSASVPSKSKMTARGSGMSEPLLVERGIAGDPACWVIVFRAPRPGPEHETQADGEFAFATPTLLVYTGSCEGFPQEPGSRVWFPHNFFTTRRIVPSE